MAFDQEECAQGPYGKVRRQEVSWGYGHQVYCALRQQLQQKSADYDNTGDFHEIGQCPKEGRALLQESGHGLLRRFQGVLGFMSVNNVNSDNQRLAPPLL